MTSSLLHIVVAFATMHVVLLVKRLPCRVQDVLPLFAAPPANPRAQHHGVYHVVIACVGTWLYYIAILAADIISLWASVVSLVGLFNAVYFGIYAASGHGIIRADSRDLLLERVEMVDIFGNLFVPSPRWPCARLVIAVSLVCAYYTVLLIK